MIDKPESEIILTKALKKRSEYNLQQTLKKPTKQTPQFKLALYQVRLDCVEIQFFMSKKN